MANSLPDVPFDKGGTEEMHAQKFCIELARCFLAFGAPAHHLEAQLTKVASVLGTRAEFLLLPSTVFASFYDEKGGSDAAGGLHAIKKVGQLSVSQLRQTHSVYKQIISQSIGPEKGWKLLVDIQKSKPPQSNLVRVSIAFCCGAAITCLAFNGSFLDAIVAGIAQGSLISLSFELEHAQPVIARIFELFATFCISFLARGLYSHTSHKICYSAVFSGGIVLTLPGFAVMSSALELSNKTMFSGSLKLVWAIFQALFIGFVQTLGSDLWLKLDPHAKASRLQMVEDITQSVYTQGMLAGNWTGDYSTQLVSLAFSHSLDKTTPYPDYNYIGTGCYRGADWPWWIQGLQWQWTIPLVPIFAFLLTLWNRQALNTVSDLKHVAIMVFFGCASYAGNMVGSTYIQGSVGSVIGAFLVSLLGSLYSGIWNGYAFPAMVPGVLLLVPTGITAVGGLAQNYDSSGSDQFASGLNTGLAMIQLSIAITVGLCLAAAISRTVVALRDKLLGTKKEAMDDSFAF